ncbi:MULTISPECIES: hypothetical protein [unclassified Nocardioides]|uniref:hypothetical protein n=1 Tax=unclassified Nocardioides TaxID=2615069 RepID=UPI001910580E|nr:MULTISPECIES: hypothetical protein [unclassified Nocardioides]
MAEQIPETWAVVREQLATARGQLTNRDDDELGLYEDFLDHNELGLALDALVDVAHAQRAPGDVWRGLSAAAQTMDLEATDSVHGPTVQRILDHLAAAHDVRGLQRMLNEWDPIGVRPDLGGPDDEYSCLYAPLLERLAGGSDPAEIALFLRAELEGHFGLDANYSQPEAFAGELVDWFAGGAPA